MVCARRRKHRGAKSGNRVKASPLKDIGKIFERDDSLWDLPCKELCTELFQAEITLHVNHFSLFPSQCLLLVH
jgi:hypothetical protein